MVIAASDPPSRVQPQGEQRVVFHGLDWDSYLHLLRLLPQSRSSRLTYDKGLLEITMPLEEHEFARCLIERFIVILVEMLGLPLKTMGSTTLNYPQFQKGAEPDQAYYIQNQPLVKGRSVDLAQDPPPDLVVEVDITHTDIAKNQFYAGLGVPEFWRFDGQIWRIYRLESGVYVEGDRSPTFPQVTKDWLYEFLRMAREDEIQAMRSLRDRFSPNAPSSPH